MTYPKEQQAEKAARIAQDGPEGKPDIPSAQPAAIDTGADLEEMRADLREALHWLEGASSCPHDRRFVADRRIKWGIK